MATRTWLRSLTATFLLIASAWLATVLLSFYYLHSFAVNYRSGLRELLTSNGIAPESVVLTDELLATVFSSCYLTTAAWLVRLWAPVLVVLAGMDLLKRAGRRLIGRGHPDPAPMTPPIERSLWTSLLALGSGAACALAIIVWLFELHRWTFQHHFRFLSAFILSVVAIGIAIAWRAFRMARRAGAQLLAYVLAPYRRYDLWLTGATMFLTAVIVAESYLPWMLDEIGEVGSRSGLTRLQAMPSTVPELLMARYSHDLRARLPTRGQAETRAGALVRLVTSEWPAMVDKMAPSDIQRAEHALIVRSASKFVAFGFAVVFGTLSLVPVLVFRPGLGTTLSIALPALIPIPTSLLADRLGVSSSFPLLFVAVSAPLAVMDAVVSSRTDCVMPTVFWVDGRPTIHLVSDCPSLANATAVRIRQENAGILRRAGLRWCRRCAKSWCDLEAQGH